MNRRRQVPLDKLAALSGSTAIQLGPVRLSRGWVLLPISPGLKCFLARCILKTCVQKDESKGPEGFQNVSNARRPKAVNSKERVMWRCTTGRILVEFTFWTRPWQVAHHLFLGTDVNNIEQPFSWLSRLPRTWLWMNLHGMLSVLLEAGPGPATVVWHKMAAATSFQYSEDALNHIKSLNN